MTNTARTANSSPEAQSDPLERLLFLARDAERRVEEAASQDERENWQLIAHDWWTKVCRIEDARIARAEATL